MRLFPRFVFFVFVTFLFSFLFARNVSASSYTLSGKVSDNLSHSISGATVSINDANADTTTTDSSGNYSLSVPQGTYNIQITPPSGSNYSSAVAFSQNIAIDTVLNFILTNAGTVTISGHLFDSLGHPLANQDIQIQGGSSPQTTTDTSGYYSLQVSVGTYNLVIKASNNVLSVNAPQDYTVTVPSYSLTQDVFRDITLPLKKVSMHTQDSSGNPISGVRVDVPLLSYANFSLSLGQNIPNASVLNGYDSGTGPTTDASGNANVWLFPNSGTQKYTFIATPPDGSSFTTTTLSNIFITGDTSETISMQQPVTLHGHIYDANGNPLADQTVQLQGGSSPQITTDSSGNYTFQVSPGTYNLVIKDTNNDLSVNAPQDYTVTIPNYVVSQNTTLNITFPLKKVTVHAQDAFGNSLSGIQVDVPLLSYANFSLSLGGNLPNASILNGYDSGAGPITNNSGDATVWLFPNGAGRSYTFTATPPSGSNYSITNLSNQSITADKNLTIVMQQPVTLSGHIYDALGIPLPNQIVQLQGYPQTTTDVSGNYSIQAVAGTYNLVIKNTNNSSSLNAPRDYTITAPNYRLNQNTTLNITFPLKKVVLHVQDAVGQAVNGIRIDLPLLDYANFNLSLSGNITNASVLDGYDSSTDPVTDASGNATVWVFPNGTGKTYTFVATPPSGSIYGTFTLSSISVTSDQTELISLQYSHAAPITTATLSPAQNSDGTYPNPVSVTLSATAASGYTVAHTYYTVDGGTQQTYSSAFNVSGNGSHTIHYWSDDNSGVTEAQNTKTFTIAATYSLSGTVYVDSNQNGFQDTGETGYSGATLTLDSGQTATTDSNGNYTFSNLSAATYTETLTLPNGYSATTTNPATVALSTDTTENFGIAQANSLVTAINAGGDTQGNFVSDTDSTGGTTYSSSATVDTSAVSNPAPQAVYQTVRYGNFTYTIPNLTANAAYTLRLHFNELYWGTSLAGNSGGEGSRVFNVSVNGTQALSNYDIFQHAGGANKAIVEQLPATADSNGNITIQFSTVTDNAMVNGIEVYNGTLPSPTPTPTPTPITSEAINAGGITTSNFLTDKAFTGGQPYSSTASVDTTGVTSPAPESVYQSVRYGNFTYALTNFVPNSTHTVRLHFNELYWGTTLTGNTGGEGSRVFNVSINNSQVLTNFDIYQQAGGANKALIKEFTATADANGKITIQFTTVTDNAMINGIEVN